MDGKQGGDPRSSPPRSSGSPGSTSPPVRFAAGADAVEVFEAKAQALLDQADAHRDLSSSLAHEDLA